MVDSFTANFDPQGILRVPASTQLRIALQALSSATDKGAARVRDIGQARAQFDARVGAALQRQAAPPGIDRVAFSERNAGGVRVLLAHPTGACEGGTIHIHGGGWCLGRPDTLRPALARMATTTSTVVAGIDYRLAPEHPHPAAHEDCIAAIGALLAHWRTTHGLDTHRIVLLGESAGAHLALLALRQLHRSNLRLAGTCLTYGFFDLSNTRPSRTHNAGSALLDLDTCRYFVQTLLGADRAVDAEVSPWLWPSSALQGLGPALFCVGSADPLFDDSIDLHERWRMAGNPAWRVEYEAAPHAFDLLPTPEADHVAAMQAGFVRHCLGVCRTLGN